MEEEEAEAALRRRWSDMQDRWVAQKRADLPEAVRARGPALALRAGYALAVAVTGRTPGKALLGLRVIDAHGARPGVAQSLVRERLPRAGLGSLVALAPWRCGPVCGMAAVLVAFDLADHLWPLADARGRTLHDLLAGTRVVHDRRR